jgi:hypothetical protein
VIERQLWIRQHLASVSAWVSLLGPAPVLQLVGRLRRNPAMPEGRLVYGCVGADQPEGQPFIDEIDGVLYYTCPECRKELAELEPSPPRE